MNEKPHRWFRFRLRTLLVAMVVLSVPLAWVGYRINWILERHKFVAAKTTGKVVIDELTGHSYWVLYGVDPPPQLRVFGEPGVKDILFLRGDLLTKQEKRRVESLFPEAILHGIPYESPQ